MNIPIQLVGTCRQVTTECRKAARKLRTGSSLKTVAGEWQMTDHFDGYISVQDPSLDRGLRGDHFFGYRLIHVLSGSNDNLRWDGWFDDLISAPWGMMCLLGQESTFLVVGRSRAERYVRAMIEHWPQLTSLGPRFCNPGPECLWKSATALWVALGQLGASADELREAIRDPAYDDGTMPEFMARLARG